MALHIGDNELITVYNGNKMAFLIPKLHAQLPQSDYSKAYITDGYGFRDGVIKGPSLDAAANSSAYYTANCSGWAVLPGQIGLDQPDDTVISTNYCLTQDMTLNLTDFVEDVTYSGILDGCGHTLTINCYRDNFSASTPHVWGPIIGTLTGAIRNITIITNFYWRNTYGSGYFQSNGADQFVGGVCGRVNGGTVSNVYLEVGHYTGTDYNMDFSGKPGENSTYSRGSYKMVGGFTGEIAGNSNFTNITIQINGMGWRNTDGGNVSKRPDVNLGIGGLAGHVASGAVVMCKNLSNLGYGDINSWAQKANSGGGTYVYKGGFIALSEGTTTFTNTNHAWAGRFTHGSDDNPTAKAFYECGIAGMVPVTQGAFNVSNVYCSQGSHVGTDGWLEYQNTKTAIISTEAVLNVIPCQRYTTGLNTSIGFLGDDLWIGNVSELQLRTLGSPIDIQGKYLDSITFTNTTGTVTVGLSDWMNPEAFTKYMVVTRPANALPASLNANILDSIIYGYYGYLSNEAGSTSNSFKLYYNNGNYIDYTPPISLGNRVGIYNMYERITQNGQVYYITRNTNSGYYINN